MSSSDLLVAPSTGVVGALPRRQAFSYDVSVEKKKKEKRKLIFFPKEKPNYIHTRVIFIPVLIKTKKKRVSFMYIWRFETDNDNAYTQDTTDGRAKAE